MAVQRLTKRVVDALRADPARDTFVWDRDLAGLGVKVNRGGRKVFVVQYRLAGLGRSSTTKRVTMSEVGTLTVEQARKQARLELGRVAQGSDPALDRHVGKRASKVREFGQAYLADVRIRRKESTANEYARIWEKYVIPALGSRPVAEVTTIELRRLHRSLSATPFMANRVIAVLGAFFTFAMREGVRPEGLNPTRGVETFPEQSREMFLTPEQFRVLGAALDRAERIGLLPPPEKRRKPKSATTAKHRPKNADVPRVANPAAVAAIRLLALTGCRVGEILALRWDEVDFEHGELRLGDTKTGRSVRPLGDVAAELLRTLPTRPESPYVLPGAIEGQPLTEIKRVWHAVRYAAGLPALRLHDLRHSFASVPADGGVSLLVIRSMLGHSRVATTERYAHLTRGPVRRAANSASADIASWMRGSDTAVTLLHDAPARKARVEGGSPPRRAPVREL